MTLPLNGLRGFAMSDNRDVLLYLKCGKCGYKTRLFATAEGKYFVHCGIPMFITRIEVYKSGEEIYATEVVDDETNK